VTEFIDDMAAAYAWADVVVCRSGALTVSEIAAAGLPALFVPFQHKDRQQYWNALPLEKAGAAKILSSHNLPLMRSPPPWRAGTETHCWRWHNAHARRYP
jgi:UDP-N-acetylglucosamine:LPS N-acetylglucosamine transferase